MLQPYIESTTTLSDYNTDDEEIAIIFCFCRSAKMDIQRLGGPRNVSVDLKYVLCLCSVYPLESGEVTA